jgi:hypothetical protein
MTLEQQWHNATNSRNASTVALVAVDVAAVVVVGGGEDETMQKYGDSRRQRRPEASLERTTIR